MRIGFIFCIMMVFGSAVSAQDLARVEKIQTSWRGWLQQNNIKQANLSIAYQGKVLHSEGHEILPSDPMPVASLSKAITAACVMHLVSDGKLALDSRLGQVFGENMIGLGVKGLHGRDITIAELLNHTSGLMPDNTQADMPEWVGQPQPRYRAVTIKALGRSKQDGKLGEFAYNNENYAILGEVISTITGTDYGPYCAAAVLQPLGINAASLQHKWGAFGPWGGWEMSAEDYAKFIAAYLGDQSLVGRDPNAWANVELNNGTHYGMGTLFRKTETFRSFWHFGLLCFGAGGSSGSYFATWQGEWLVVTTFDACPKWEVLGALDAAMGQAAVR